MELRSNNIPNASRSLPPLVFEPANNDKADYQQLQNPASILRKLQELQRKRFSIKLRMYEDNEVIATYRSSLQRIELETQSLILHQLVPNSWREQVLSRHPVSISCRMPSGHLVFDSFISPLEHGPNNLFCKLEFPTVLHQQQLRSAFRVPLLPNTNRVQLRLGHHLLDGKCMDLSLTGCCAQFSGSFNELMTERPVVVEELPLRFEYKGEEVFQTKTKLCRHKQESNGTITMGLCFAKTDPQLSRQLQPLLLSLQRESIRQHPTAYN